MSAQKTLSIDIGGTGLKASVLNEAGEMLTEPQRIPTPKPSPPAAVVPALMELVAPLGEFDRISVGFPGVVRKGRVITAPNLGTEHWEDFNLQQALEEKLQKPARVINDADMQGLAAVRGEGLEMVITLGTGFGTAIYVDGKLGPHLELAHHPFRDGETYDVQLGDKTLKAIGVEPWKERVQEAINNLRILTNFDCLYIGGGNSRHLNFDQVDDIEIVDNTAGILGGIYIWRS